MPSDYNHIDVCKVPYLKYFNAARCLIYHRDVFGGRTSLVIIWLEDKSHGCILCPLPNFFYFDWDELDLTQEKSLLNSKYSSRFYQGRNGAYSRSGDNSLWGGNVTVG